MNKLKAVCELKSKLNELEVAKLNAERARIGLPPKRPWFVERDRQRQADRQTDRNRQKQTETDRNRQKQTETD